jgi:hypothetical protein
VAIAVTTSPPQASQPVDLASVFGELQPRSEKAAKAALPVINAKAVGIAETAPNRARSLAVYGAVAVGAAALLMMTYFADAWRRRD